MFAVKRGDFGRFEPLGVVAHPVRFSVRITKDMSQDLIALGKAKQDFVRAAIAEKLERESSEQDI